MSFSENYKIDYKKTNVVEKKGRFDYISWAHCQKMMKEIDEHATFTMKWNEQLQSYNWKGFVIVEMTLKERTVQHAYPILDNQNKPIKDPSAFDINNAQMRGFAKLFSMETGHGLNLFTGEDLTVYDVQNVKEEKKVDTKQEFIEVQLLLQKVEASKRQQVIDLLGKNNIDISNDAISQKDIAVAKATIMKVLKKQEEQKKEVSKNETAMNLFMDGE